MTSVIRDSNLLAISEEFAQELGLHPGSPVEVTRTANGFEVRPARSGIRRGADGVWRTLAERKSMWDNARGEGLRLAPNAGSQVEALIRDRELDDLLDRMDEL